MASAETQRLDSIISSRRAMIVKGAAAALTTFTFPNPVQAAKTVASFSDNDILNFALNLEYLEANFYYLAAFGTTIDKANTASVNAGGPAAGIPITGTGNAGTVLVKSNPKVAFSSVAVGQYCVEVAIDEGRHVLFLRTALGTATVAQPSLDLQTSFNNLAMGAGIGATFDPFGSDTNFLLGAYLFEDVGVSAYHGAAPLFTTTATGKAYLAAAVGIHAVEAYHASLIRTTLLALDSTGSMGLLDKTQRVSNFRAMLAAQAPQAPANPNDPSPDDYGVSDGAFTVSLAGSAGVPRTTLADVDPVNMQGFARSTTQVLNIVTGGGGVTPGAAATGGFFPAGFNGVLA